MEVTDADGHRSTLRAVVIDFVQPEANDWLAVRQLTVQGEHLRRPDVVLYVNGLPLVDIELKNPAGESVDIEATYQQLQTDKADIPQLFYTNLLNVVSDGTNVRYGSLTATTLTTATGAS